MQTNNSQQPCAALTNSQQPCAAPIQWDEAPTSQELCAALTTKSFSDLTAGQIYIVNPVKIVVTKFGPKLLLEVERQDDPKHESFSVFAPTFYRERVSKTCGKVMVRHLMRYNGMEFRSNKKIHSYNVATLHPEEELIPME